MNNLTLTVVTGNKNKAAEIGAITGMPVTNVGLEIPEIQSLDVVEVAKAKARDAYDRLKVPVVVDDTGMRIEGLGGLPGALVVWFLDTVGPQGILRMMQGVPDRRASVSTCVAFCDGKTVEAFEGVVSGCLTLEIRGANGFGYDPIFVPDGDDKTYAEMTSDEKNRKSMRSIALGKLRTFLQSYAG